MTLSLCIVAAAIGFCQVPSADAKSSLSRLTERVDALLTKEQPKLFAWHLRSLRALATTEYAKLELGQDQSARLPLATRKKEFIEYVDRIADGLQKQAFDPDLYLEQGRRSLILARPAAMDGSLQYMMVDLPAGWDPQKEYPLSIGLHGTGPDNPLAYPSFAMSVQDAPKEGPDPSPMTKMIRLAPWGRGNSSWRNDNERDLWEAVNLLHSFAKTDPDRWYLNGHSAGGDGVWYLVQHTPDRWAAVSMQSGSMMNGEPQWGLIPNMTYVPTYILIGEKDNLYRRVPDSKLAYEILKKAGTDTKLNILPGIGHYPLSEEGYRDQDKWLAGHVRKRPTKFEFSVDNPNHPGVWGIEIVPNDWERRVMLMPWPHFECEIVGQEARVRTQRIMGLKVTLGSAGLKMSGRVKLLVNGKTVFEGEASNQAITVERP